MTKEFGRNEDRLADMTVVPPTDRYECPPKDECHTAQDYPIDLGDGFQIYLRVLEHEGRTCFFSLQLSAKIDGVWEPLSRIDTEHDVVHQHFYRRGVYDSFRSRIEFDPIPLEDPHGFLDTSFQAAYATLVDNASTLLERWH